MRYKARAKAISKAQEAKKNLVVFLILISLLIFISVVFKPVSAENMNVSFDNFWSRASLGESKVGAIYGDVHNHLSKDIFIISAMSDVAERVELHNHIQDENGVMRMRQVEQIKVEPNTSLHFKPGGLHIMLIGLSDKLKVGEKHSVTLKTKSGENYDIEFIVEDPVKKVDHHKHNHDHSGHH